MKSYTNNQELYKTYTVTDNKTGRTYKAFTDCIERWIVDNLGNGDHTIQEDES